MPVINFDEFQDKIKERTKGMRTPKMPDRDVRDRNPYESDALARKVRESWLSNFDKGIMKMLFISNRGSFNQRNMRCFYE